MGRDTTDWVAERLEESERLEVVGRTPENFLIVKADNGYSFPVAVLGVKGVVEVSDVEPLFAKTNKPEFVVNVPTTTLWSGSAIRRIHAESAAFGKLGDVARAAATGDAGSWRDKNMGFFINAIQQHSNVSSVSYIYDRVFVANRIRGPSLTVAVIDAYNMAAEDVRNARNRYGQFNIIVKSSNYGSITYQAEETAKSMGAQALTLKDLMRRLAR